MSHIFQDKNRVKEFRSRRGLTQQQLCTASGVHTSLISRIELGGGCGTDTAQRLARALSTTVEELFPLSEQGIEEETAKTA